VPPFEAPIDVDRHVLLRAVVGCFAVRRLRRNDERNGCREDGGENAQFGHGVQRNRLEGEPPWGAPSEAGPAASITSRAACRGDRRRPMRRWGNYVQARVLE